MHEQSITEWFFALAVREFTAPDDESPRAAAVARLGGSIGTHAETLDAFVAEGETFLDLFEDQANDAIESLRELSDADAPDVDTEDVIDEIARLAGLVGRVDRGAYRAMLEADWRERHAS